MKLLLIKANILDVPKRFFNPMTGKAPFDVQTIYSPPLGLLYMASCLQNEGHNVEIIDCFYEENPNEKIQQSIKSADAVGFSIFTDFKKFSTKC